MIGKKIKVCKDQENATLMLYHNICNIWHKNVIEISYKNHKFSVCFLLAASVRVKNIPTRKIIPPVYFHVQKSVKNIPGVCFSIRQYVMGNTYDML